ncbi:MAG TPA: AAA family ATPase [Candidatus Micrarchaeia archaeon]|nr:AAA family ATPase [Candidatus Micrarchaeia archaeon]
MDSGERAEIDPAEAAELDPLNPTEFRQVAAAIEAAVAARVVGQREAVRGALICLIAGGHALLEGVPGLGKTTMVRAFAAALDLRHHRIQFTPDLMPADITGTTVLMEGGAGTPRLNFQRGPIFAGLVLADEINRASPRTQSALLEAMQEGAVTIAGVTHPLPRPFCVMATQNPVEMHGTYPLPEAELDRFFLKLRFEYPSASELTSIVTQSTGAADPAALPVADAGVLLRMTALAHRVPAASHVLDYISRLVLALQPGPDAPALVRDFVRLGPSPRGAQALSLAGRITALVAGRPNLAFEDVHAVALLALRHRLVLSFDAERHGVGPETIVADALERTPDETT